MNIKCREYSLVAELLLPKQWAGVRFSLLAPYYQLNNKQYEKRKNLFNFNLYILQNG